MTLGVISASQTSQTRLTTGPKRKTILSDLETAATGYGYGFHGYGRHGHGNLAGGAGHYKHFGKQGSKYLLFSIDKNHDQE